MNVKLQGLVNGAGWIEATYGPPALAKVLRACSPAVRERYVSAIAMNWHPLDEFLEFVTVADRVLGSGDGAVVEALGAAGARANMKSVMLRVVFYISKPDFLMRRIAGMWSQFNDEGTMELVSVEPMRLAVRVSGIPELPPTFVRVLTGWARVVTGAVSAGHPMTRILSYVEKGEGASCVWELSWTKTAPSAAGGKSRE
jgi:hypothetical protein